MGSGESKFSGGTSGSRRRLSLGSFRNQKGKQGRGSTGGADEGKFAEYDDEERNYEPSLQEQAEDMEDDEQFAKELRRNIKRLIAYAQSADPTLQREVAETLANQAVKPTRQQLIVELGGLDLLIPLVESDDGEVRRLSAHALANLSVDPENQVKMANEGGIEMIVSLLENPQEAEQTLRQAAKALANLGVNAENKELIAQKNGIQPLIRLLNESSIPVQIEAGAAIANLAVNDDNERRIAELGGLEPVLKAISSRDVELSNQAARALRNLSVNEYNQSILHELEATTLIQTTIALTDDAHTRDQCRKALFNLVPMKNEKK